MYDRLPVVSLRDRLALVAASHPSLTDDFHERDIRDRVCAAVIDLKALGWPPERVVVAIKQIAEDAGLSHTRGLFIVSSPLIEQNAVIMAIVRWAIVQYFASDAGTAEEN
jgi:hypothetical protein